VAKVKLKNTRRVARGLSLKTRKKFVNVFYKNRDAVIAEITGEILSGRSPVAGKRWDPYSTDYANRFKDGSKKPVNMYLTGKMLKSLKIKKQKTAIAILFDSKIAVYHDRLGAGVSKVIRRLLPDPSKGERFNIKIRTVIKTFLMKAFRR